MFETTLVHLTRTLANGTPSQGLRLYIDLYLGRDHRNHRPPGCPLAALSGDVARMDVPGKQASGGAGQGTGRVVLISQSFEMLM